MKLFLPILSIALLGSFSRVPDTQLFVSRHENVLGTSLEMKFRAANEQQANLAEAAALTEIDRLKAILSAWDSNSEFRRWARTQNTPVPVSPELFEVLGLFDTWRAETNGALDPSVEAFTRLWKQGKPSPAQLASAIAAVHQTHWRLDRINGTATHLTATPLALNSFAKSYVVQHAADAALAAGVSGALINIGGDLVIRGNLEDTVSIVNPRADAENDLPLATLPAKGQAIATSGSYRRGFTIDGQHLSHIIDPRTGIPSGHVLSSTVIAQDAVTAGALATAFSVMSIDQSIQLAKSFTGVQYFIVPATGPAVHSAAWSTLAAAPDTTVASPYEVSLQLELPTVQAQRYRRPFVAIWVEDKDKFPVRTVALWFDRTRWLPELKAWYRGDRMRALAEGNDITGTVSSATRPPGKYSIKWDGKDGAGKPVKPGKYTVYIEAAREHGSYQLLHQEIDIAGAPAQFTLPGGGELGAVTLDYRKSAR